MSIDVSGLHIFFWQSTGIEILKLWNALSGRVWKMRRGRIKRGQITFSSWWRIPITTKDPFASSGFFVFPFLEKTVSGLAGLFWNIWSTCVHVCMNKGADQSTGVFSQFCSLKRLGNRCFHCTKLVFLRIFGLLNSEMFRQPFFLYLPDDVQ